MEEGAINKRQDQELEQIVSEEPISSKDIENDGSKCSISLFLLLYM
jgi:hypothetical protein